MSPTSPTMKFPLLKLPRELRDKVYYHALARIVSHSDEKFENDRTCCLYLTDTQPPSVWKKMKLPGIALLRTNKQLHQEASSVLYESTPFALRRGSLRPFVQMIGHSNCRNLRHLMVTQEDVGIYWGMGRSDENPECARRSRDMIAASFPRLRTLEIWTFSVFDYTRTFEPIPSHRWPEERAAFTAVSDEIWDSIINALPNLHDATLIVRGCRKGFLGRDGFVDNMRLHCLLLAEELGWKIKRQHVRTELCGDTGSDDVNDPESFGWHLVETEIIENLEKVVEEGAEGHLRCSEGPWAMCQHE